MPRYLTPGELKLTDARAALLERIRDGDRRDERTRVRNDLLEHGWIRPLFRKGKVIGLTLTDMGKRRLMAHAVLWGSASQNAYNDWDKHLTKQMKEHNKVRIAQRTAIAKMKDGRMPQVVAALKAFDHSDYTVLMQLHEVKFGKSGRRTSIGIAEMQDVAQRMLTDRTLIYDFVMKALRQGTKRIRERGY